MSIEHLLLGVALGAIPSATLGQIMTAWFAQRLGVKPADIKQYRDATDEDADEGEQSAGN